jgi:hypothetical protein
MGVVARDHQLPFQVITYVLLEPESTKDQDATQKDEVGQLTPSSSLKEAPPGSGGEVEDHEVPFHTLSCAFGVSPPLPTAKQLEEDAHAMSSELAADAVPGAASAAIAANTATINPRNPILTLSRGSRN